ncbi:toxin-antitoxin system TumE family protein [Haladaptatus cibarius]|uniref:toxin-antitoxin system TumE family protein n=1 Tax=Haladaptatus cibarius TaxID=453847 RepID=UPI000679C9E5|nr:DUF6516 family protein [Haladaptatus cibarius]
MADDDLEVSRTRKFDGYVESILIRKAPNHPRYPCGWKYRLHFGVLGGETVVRYDNAHETTKGHERHTGNEVTIIEFPGMADLYRRFVREVNEYR